MIGSYFLAPAFLALGIIFLIISPALWLMGRSRGTTSWTRPWALSFVANGVGFICWGFLMHTGQVAVFALGDIFHVTAFLLVAGGAARFSGRAINRWYVAAAAGILALWVLGVILLAHGLSVGEPCLLIVRIFPVGTAAVWILRHKPGSQPMGQILAGWCLVAWTLLMLGYPAFRQVEALRTAFFGLGVGLHLAAAMGLMVVMADSLRQRVEVGEARVQTLEGLLPICSGCKKVRTDDGTWEEIEVYVSQRSDANFSHGLCDQCLKRLYPEIARSLAAKGHPEQG